MNQNLDLKIAILKKYRCQSDFSMAIGAHESKVSQVIHGRRKLSRDEAKLWQIKLGCNKDLLLEVTMR